MVDKIIMLVAAAARAAAAWAERGRSEEEGERARAPSMHSGLGWAAAARALRCSEYHCVSGKSPYH